MRDGRRAGPHFRERSVFDGLARRQVGQVDLIAHSVAVLTPSLSALGTGLALPAMVGPGFWLSALLGFGLAGALALVFDQFASRFNAAGSLYTYVAEGLGATVALIVGVAHGAGVRRAHGLRPDRGRAPAGGRLGGDGRRPTRGVRRLAARRSPGGPVPGRDPSRHPLVDACRPGHRGR